MSDIERFFPLWGGGGMMPANNGKYVRYADHRAEVERLKQKRDDYRAEFERLVVERDDHRFGEEQRTAERDKAQAEVERLKNTLFPWDTYDRLKNANEHLKEDVAKLTAERNEAQAEVERLTRERDEARDERDAVQRERERLQDLLTLAGRELSTLREALRVRRRDQSAQNPDMVANCKETLTSSRPDDETIWREAFMSQLHDRYWAASEVADVALAEYRKRWPR